MRFTSVIAIMVLAGCGSSETETAASCDAPCEAVLHASGKVGIPVGADPVLLRVCIDDACVEEEVAVPAASVTVSAGTDPKLDATIERTTDPFADDLVGVFAFDVTWSSSSKRIQQEDHAVVSVTRPDGGNVSSVGHSVDGAEVGACGCSTVELAF
jgi:hypothetical protein